MFNSPYRDQNTSVLVRDGSLTARDLDLTPAKIRWIWTEIQKCRSLFNDFTRGRADNFEAIIQDPFSCWIEIQDDDKIVGLIYLTGLNTVIDAEIHMIFFDRKPASKINITRKVINHFFTRFIGLRRITATMPYIYHATIRMARRLGFKQEGIKRQSQLMGARYIDEAIFGLLASEAISGSNN